MQSCPGCELQRGHISESGLVASSSGIFTTGEKNATVEALKRGPVDFKLTHYLVTRRVDLAEDAAYHA